jgi:hypothetical protein
LRERTCERLALVRSFVWSLQRMYVNGAVQKEGMGLGARWTLPKHSH